MSITLCERMLITDLVVLVVSAPEVLEDLEVSLPVALEDLASFPVEVSPPEDVLLQVALRPEVLVDLEVSPQEALTVLPLGGLVVFQGV